jgi:hypothetical protein
MLLYQAIPSSSLSHRHRSYPGRLAVQTAFVVDLDPLTISLSVRSAPQKPPPPA